MAFLGNYRHRGRGRDTRNLDTGAWGWGQTPPHGHGGKGKHTHTDTHGHRGVGSEQRHSQGHLPPTLLMALPSPSPFGIWLPTVHLQQQNKAKSTRC